jgi:BirA family biotin operon repressor/biotin-[acetyl-CoA-carboxylase] ligase
MALAILGLLADGKTQSGSVLAARLGISRTAVWKQIACWRKRGMMIEAIPGRGYRLLKKIEPWSREELLQEIGAEVAGLLQVFRVEEKVTSTNDVVAALMSAPSSKRILCLAEEQTQGRGRRGRAWYSPPGTGFYGSFGWTYESGLSVIQGLSLAVGVIAAKCLHQCGVAGVQLKWPNDLLIGDKKLGGILIEAQAEADGLCKVVVGVGINIELLEGAGPAVGRPVTDVMSNISSRVSRNQLGASLVREITLLLQRYPLEGFSALRDEWTKYDALLGASVTVTGLTGHVAGVACGVSDSGALLLKTSSGEVVVHGGEISVTR